MAMDKSICTFPGLRVILPRKCHPLFFLKVWMLIFYSNILDKTVELIMVMIKM